jgi:hypothetical protein
MESVKAAVCVLMVLVSQIHTSLSATAIGLSALNKDYRNQCIDDMTGKAYRLHSTWPMKAECGQQTCVKYSNQLYIQYQTCGNVDTAAPCRIVENPEASYPECCPRVVCDAVDDQVNTLTDDTIADKNDDNISNHIDIDDYFQYDDLSSNDDHLFMMSSYDTLSYDTAVEQDYFMSGDEISDQQHHVHDVDPVEYMIDWDTLFAPRY